MKTKPQTFANKTKNTKQRGEGGGRSKNANKLCSYMFQFEIGYMHA